MSLSALQLDRAAGTLLAAACGDALGVPYEPSGRGPADGKPRMLGGGYGGYAAGEYSDDTQMAVVIARVAATGADLREGAALDEIARGFLVDWYGGGATDIGKQTRALLRRASQQHEPGPLAGHLYRLAAEQHADTGCTAGNGSLMRTAPVALAHRGDPAAIVAAARAVSALTHYDPEAGDACALWCLAIDHAVHTGHLDLRAGLSYLQDPSGWSARLDAAEAAPPAAFARQSGWVVAALQQAWSAICHTPPTDRPAKRLRAGIETAIHAGGDTDTVAAIAGALLGAAHGASAVPADWRRRVHGWPGLRARDLTRLAVLTARGGQPDSAGWPSITTMVPTDASGADRPVPHPDDAGVRLGTLAALRPGVADAVVSLCRLGVDDAPLPGVQPADHIEVWLVDKDDANNDLPFVLADTASVIRDLRAEGKTVFLHCAYGKSRTPIVAAAYGALITGDPAPAVLERVQQALPSCSPRPSLAQALKALPGSQP